MDTWTREGDDDSRDVEPMTGAIEEARLLVDTTTGEITPADETATAQAPDAPLERQLVFANVGEFVEQLVLTHFRRELGGEVWWCQQWFKHTEAVARFTALWFAWEHMRAETAKTPTSMAAFWRDFFDPFMAAITTRKGGPFEACNARKGEHNVVPMLPFVPSVDHFPPPTMALSEADKPQS